MTTVSDCLALPFLRYQPHHHSFCWLSAEREREREIILRNWLMQLWRYGKSKIFRVNGQAGWRPMKEGQLEFKGSLLTEFLLTERKFNSLLYFSIYTISTIQITHYIIYGQRLLAEIGHNLWL